MFEDLDPRLTQAIEALRKEFDDKIADLARIVSAPPEKPAEEPAAETTAVPIGGPEIDLLEELKLAATEIDLAESQADVLDELLRGTSRFSSRAAVFLHREGALKGWGGAGFEENNERIKDLELDAPSGSPWDQIASGEGGVGLSANDCAVLTTALGAEAAQVGVLLPFVLQNKVAAVVYADRRESDEPFSVAGLQLLSFLAGLTVETLPLRSRASTSSLRLAVAPVPEAETVEEVAAAPEPDVEEAPAEIAVEPTVEPEAPWGEGEEAGIPEGLEATEEVTAPEAVAPIDEAPAEELAAEEPGDAGLAAVPEAPVEEPEAFEAPVEEPPVEAPPAEAIPSIEEEVLVVEAPEEVAEPAPPVTPEEADIAEPESQQPPTEVEPEPKIEPSSLGTTQVQPPQDVEGPGWAFTTTKIPTAAGTEAMHEEARRLARLLVTEIKLYNEELVEEGRRSSDVYSRLREDIDRSRQIFDDRIDPEVRSEKDYFHEALVRILAGGDPSVLGA